METVLQVKGMSCAHCVQAVEQAIADLPGVVRVQADLTSGAVRVQMESAVTPDQLREAVEEAGYELVVR